MKKTFFLALGLLLFFGPAGAVDKKGKVGAGFFNDDAPIGARWWVTDRFGVDLGFGIDLRNVVDSTVDTNLLSLIAIEPSKKTLTEFRFDAGFPINLIRTEKVNFLARPGFVYQRAGFFNRIFKPSPDTTIVTESGLDSVVIPGRGVVLDTITDDRSRIIDISLTFGVEYFPTESFSVSLFTGIGAQNVQRSRWRRDANGAYIAGDPVNPGNPRTNEGARAKEESLWTVTHRPFLKGVNIGFHYYF